MMLQPKNYTNQLLKNSKEIKSMQGLKIIFGQQIQFEGDYCLLKVMVLNIYSAS